MHWSMHINGDPNKTLETEETEEQFYIKWKGWSHINNTWESNKSLGKKIVGFSQKILFLKLLNMFQSLPQSSRYREGIFENNVYRKRETSPNSLLFT